jgi:hypothetical protein
MKKLLDMLVFKGGAIVSTASLSHDQIKIAREQDRMYVDLLGHGFVWMPKESIMDWTINDNQTTQS